MRERRHESAPDPIDDEPFYDDTDLAVQDLIHGPDAHPRRSAISDKTWAELQAYLRVRDRGPANPTCYLPVYVGGCRWRYVHESKLGDGRVRMVAQTTSKESDAAVDEQYQA
jgi:hypothetical protein